MKHLKSHHLWMLFFISCTVLSGCGVKGPPLPPVPASAEFSDAMPEPSTTPGR